MTQSTRVVFFLFVLVFLTSSAFSQWVRQDSIPAPLPESRFAGGIGNMITNVDFDGDGFTEVYICNHGWDIGPFGQNDYVPAIYKYEDEGNGWEVTWSAEYPTIEAQNTWPAFTYGDLDKDGKMEIILMPVNYFTENQPNPDRVLVYESDGADGMGVPDGFGGWLPNSADPLVAEEGFNVRPFRAMVMDVDGDEQNELVFADRRASSSLWSFGILSVSDVPDNGDGSETWTVEANGVTAGLALVENKWDLAFLNGTLYLFDEVEMGRVRWNADSSKWTALPGQAFDLDGRGSWKSAQVYDIDGNAADEIIISSWLPNDADGDGKNDPAGVYILEEDAAGDSLVATQIAVIDSALYGTPYLYGGAIGDIDNNGKTDYVFGTRNSDPNGIIFRLEYQGAQDDVSNPDNWELSVVDIAPTDGGRWGVLGIANVDADFNLEVLYTSSVPTLEDLNPLGVQPIRIMDFPSQVTPGPWTKVAPPASTPDGVFGGDTLGLVHAVAVDGQDRVWVSGWGAGHLIVYNAAGDSLFAVDSITVPKAEGGDTTLYTSSSRGMTTDADGNIIYGQSGYIAKLNGNTGEGMAWLSYDGGSPGAPVVDDEGFIYVAPVVGATPVSVIDPATFTVTQKIDLDPLPGTFLRGIFVSADGTTIIPGNLDAGVHSLYQFTSSDFINYPLADSIRYNNAGEPILVTQSVTMDRTPDGAMWLSQDNSYAAAGPDQNANALIRFDWDNMTYSETEMPEEGANKYDGPRGAAWNSDGTKMYVASWNRGVVWEYTGNFFVTALEKNNEIIPASYKLDQNYPNPFNPTTEINFTITKANKTSLKIFNVLGQEVATLVNKNLPAGAYKFNFDASRLASGTYIYKLESGDFVDSKKMTLIK